VREQQMNAALQRIEQSDVIAGKSVRIRVEDLE
jgi:hypothetical protein